MHKNFQAFWHVVDTSIHSKNVKKSYNNLYIITLILVTVFLTFSKKLWGKCPSPVFMVAAAQRKWLILLKVFWERDGVYQNVNVLAGVNHRILS